MRILLLNPRLKNWSPNIYVPLGLGYIAAVLEQAEHDVKIFDLNVRNLKDESLRKLARDYDIIGITGMITEYNSILDLANLMKKGNSRAQIILGGPMATALPRQVLDQSRTDLVVIGEGEETIVALVDAISQSRDLGTVRGIAYKKDGTVQVTEPVEPIADPDTIPFPARHLLDMKRYLGNHFESFGIKLDEFGRIQSTNLISSRGCPYACTFCFKEMWGNKWRGRSPENIIEEMISLNRNYGVNGFFFTDDTFVLNRDRVMRLCELIRENGLNVAWYCNARVNLMSEELLAAMYQAGCRGIAYGLESGNQQILDSMKKNITLDQVRQVVGWTKAAGINTTGYFMIGMLGETRKTILETLAFARELDLDFYGFSLTTPLVRTQLYDAALEAGMISGDRSLPGEWSLHVNANLTRDCSDSDLVGFENQAFKEFFLKKRFGKYYFVNFGFLKEEARVLLGLRNKDQARELAGKIKSVLGSYFTKSSQ